jgi:hypothetical protein
VLEIGSGAAMPTVSPEVVERIIHSDPFAHWWHGGLILPGAG